LLLRRFPVLQARKQNPKAFVFSSRGKAKLQKARTAEKEQRRMHGAQQAAGSRQQAAGSRQQAAGSVVGASSTAAAAAVGHWVVIATTHSASAHPQRILPLLLILLLHPVCHRCSCCSACCSAHG
jgi:hypothetical protein